MRKCEKRKRVFIIGSGRNGSTLLASILNEHPDICFMPEQYWLHKALRNKKIMPDLLFCHWLSRAVNKSLWPEYNPKDMFKYLRSAATRDEMIDRVYKKFTSKPFWGDHSPHMTFYVRRIVKSWPRANFIYLHRDHDQVIRSYAGMGRKREAIYRIVQAKSMYSYLRKIRALCISTSYEALTNNAQRQDELRSIQKFLEVPVMKLKHDPDKAAKKMGVEGMAHHRNLSRRVFENS